MYCIKDLLVRISTGLVVRVVLSWPRLARQHFHGLGRCESEQADHLLSLVIPFTYSMHVICDNYVLYDKIVKGIHAVFLCSCCGSGVTDPTSLLKAVSDQ